MDDVSRPIDIFENLYSNSSIINPIYKYVIIHAFINKNLIHIFAYKDKNNLKHIGIINNEMYVEIFQKYKCMPDLLCSEPNKKFENHVIKDYGSYPFRNHLILTDKKGINRLNLLLSYALQKD